MTISASDPPTGLASTLDAGLDAGLDPDRPLGRDAVREALVLATTELIVERGLSMSVREIAARAGVNHGLVHTYFGSKDGLLSAAFDEINARAAAGCECPTQPRFHQQHGLPGSRVPQA